MTRIVMAIALASCSEQPQRQVSAVVVSIAEHTNPKWNAEELVVTARSGDGAIGNKSVLRTRLRCRIGDTVHGTARGITLELDRSACES